MDFTIWKTQNKKYEVFYSKEFDVYLSSECYQKKCKAIDFLNVLKTMQLKKEDDLTSKNPGSPICHQLNGKIVIARNERNSEVAFCEAADGSLVELSGLAK